MEEPKLTDVLSRLESTFPEFEVHRIDRAVSLPHMHKQKVGWNIILLTKEDPIQELDRSLTQSALKVAAVVGVRTLGDKLLSAPVITEDIKSLIREAMAASIEEAESDVVDAHNAAKDDATRQ